MRAALALLAVLAVLATSCVSPAVAPSPAASAPLSPSPLSLAPIEACGTVKAWTAPTAAQAGSLAIGTQTHSVNPGTRHDQTGFTPVLGKAMCLFGGLDGQPAASHGAALLEAPFCGAVLAFAAATPSAAGSVTVLHFAAATLTVPSGVDLGRPPAGVRRCFSVDVDAGGNAVARGIAGPSILDLESQLWCGVVKTYAPGSVIAIGTRRWDMAAGAGFQSAAVNPPDRTEPGKPTCLTAAIDDNGRITRYRTDGMPVQEGGLVTSYVAPRGNVPGTLVFSYKYARRVAPGAVLDAQPGAYVCVTYELDGDGDRVATRTIPCPSVQVN